MDGKPTDKITKKIKITFITANGLSPDFRRNGTTDESVQQILNGTTDTKKIK